jgi:hypothetical protein
VDLIDPSLATTSPHYLSADPLAIDTGTPSIFRLHDDRLLSVDLGQITNSGADVIAR